MNLSKWFFIMVNTWWALFAGAAGLGFLSGGCATRGTNKWNETANPQTLVEADPINRKFTVFSNDGRSVKAKKLGYKNKDGAEFTADNLEVAERSVENRNANVQQLQTAGVAQANIETIRWAGINTFASNLEQAGFPLVSQAITGHYQVATLKAQQPGLVQQAIGAITAGLTTREGLLPLLPPEVSTEVAARLDSANADNAALKKELAELKASIKANQPEPTAPTPGVKVDPTLLWNLGLDAHYSAAIKKCVHDAIELRAANGIFTTQSDIPGIAAACGYVTPPPTTGATPHEEDDAPAPKPQAQAPLYRSTDRVELARLNL
jgi:hypothetical protein